MSVSPAPPCQGLAQDILSDLVEDACLGLCFEVHRAVKQGYFFLDDTDQESMRDFGEHKVTLSTTWKCWRLFLKPPTLSLLP